MASNSRQQTCFSFVMSQKSFNKPFEFLLYKTNRLHFSVRVYCNISQKTSQRVKNNSHATRLRLVLFCSLHAVTSSDLLQYDAIDTICVCPLIDHGQQPMKTHTEVTLSYNL